jgi:hypothetical protein
VDHAIDLDLRTPETEPDVSSRSLFAQIQLTPAVQSHQAEKIFDGIRLVFAVRPQLGQRMSKSSIGV